MQHFANVCFENDGGSFVFPALQAVHDVCLPICLALKILEATTKPTMHAVLPFLENCREELQKIISSGSIVPDSSPPHVSRGLKMS